MENVIAEVNPGEFHVKFEKLVAGKLSLKDLGFSNENLQVEGGNLRIMLEFGNLGEVHFYKMPTIEIEYVEKIGESEWQVEFNDEVVLDKTDHSGHSTLMMINRSKLDALKHRHINNMIIRADMPKAVHINAENSFINILEQPGS